MFIVRSLRIFQKKKKNWINPNIFKSISFHIFYSLIFENFSKDFFFQNGSTNSSKCISFYGSIVSFFTNMDICGEICQPPNFVTSEKNVKFYHFSIFLKFGLFFYLIFFLFTLICYGAHRLNCYSLCWRSCVG